MTRKGERKVVRRGIRPTAALIRDAEVLVARLQTYPCVAGPCTKRDPEMACDPCAARFYAELVVRRLRS
jgi:hypothetical protein